MKLTTKVCNHFFSKEKHYYSIILAINNHPYFFFYGINNKRRKPALFISAKYIKIIPIFHKCRIIDEAFFKSVSIS